MTIILSTLSFRFSRFFIFLFGLCVFLSMSPYFMWNSGAFKYLSLSLFLMAFLYFLKFKSLSLKSLFLLFYSFFTLIVLNLSSDGQTFFLNSSFLLTFAFLLLCDVDKFKVYKVYKTIFAISLVPGLMIFFFSLIGLHLPWYYLSPVSQSKVDAGLFYKNYIVSLVLNTQLFDAGVGEIFRYSSLYDEPGVVGTVCALLLVANKFRLNGFTSKIFLLSGLVSFSLAFYLLSAFYVFLKKPSFIFKVCFPIVFFTFLFYDQLSNNELLKRFVFERVESFLQSPLSVDNRVSSCFKGFFDDYLIEGSYFLGSGPWAHTKLGCDVSSYLSIIFNYGFWGGGLIFFFYVFLFISLRNASINIIKFIPFFIVFALSLYQRPDFFSLWFIVIFSSSVLAENTFQLVKND